MLLCKHQSGFLMVAMVSVLTISIVAKYPGGKWSLMPFSQQQRLQYDHHRLSCVPPVSPMCKQDWLNVPVTDSSSY